METNGVIRSGDRTVTTAKLRQEALNTFHAGHAAATTLLTKATQEVIDIEAATRLITGNLGPQGTLDSDRSSQILLEHRSTPDLLHGLSPARVIFGNEPNSFLPAEYQPKRKADLRKQAHAVRISLGARLQGSSCHRLQPPYS